MSTLSFSQIEDLWTSNGGNPLAAPMMAAIAIAESGGRTDAHNPKPPDDSYGLWQINYYGPLAAGRTASYGSPTQLVADPARQAKAAIAISGNGSNYRPWSTYTNGSAQRVLSGQGGSLGAIPATPSLAVNPTLVATGSGGGEAPDVEGYLIDVTNPGPIPNLKVSRRAVRNVVGALVMVGGGVLALAGVFLLRGGRAPGPAGVIQGAIRQRGYTQRTRLTQEGITQRQESRQQSSRARSASKSPAGRYGAARAAGEQAADEAGEFE